jgi:hypothetical protein
MGAPTKNEVALKQMVKELMEEGKQVVGELKDLKERYNKCNELYERGKKLVDRDTRDAAIFKEVLDLLMKEAGDLIGEDLTKQPYFVINQRGIDALIDAIVASDTINNARETLRGAEAEFTKLKNSATEFAREEKRTFANRWHALEAVLGEKNRRQFDWPGYVNKMNDIKFRDSTREQALSEKNDALGVADWILEDISGEVNLTLIMGFGILQEYYALAAAGANIVLAEKTYEQKIRDLSDSSSTVQSGMGKLEQARRWNERGYDAVENRNGGGKSLADRVASVMDDPNSAAKQMGLLISRCLDADTLLRIDVIYRYLPWEIPLPPA